MEWCFESVALPVSERGVGVTFAAATRLPAEERPVLLRLELVAGEAEGLEGLGRGDS